MSKRNHKRLVKKKSDLHKNRRGDTKAATESLYSANFVEIVGDLPELGEDIEEVTTPKLNLKEKIENWYIETGPSTKCLEKLLAILEEEGLEAPLSAAALMDQKQQQVALNKKVNQMCHNCAELSKQFDSYKDTSQKQYKTILGILAEQKVLLNRIVGRNAVVSNIMGIFPIKSEDKLKEFDGLLKTQPDPYIRQMKMLLDSNSGRNLHKVFDTEIIMNFNVDGSFGKKRLRDFGNVFKAIMDAISSYSENADKTLRAAFQRQKKKYLKQTSRSKAKKQIKCEIDGDSSEKE